MVSYDVCFKKLLIFTLTSYNSHIECLYNEMFIYCHLSDLIPQIETFYIQIVIGAYP